MKRKAIQLFLTLVFLFGILVAFQSAEARKFIGKEEKVTETWTDMQGNYYETRCSVQYIFWIAVSEMNCEDVLTLSAQN